MSRSRDTVAHGDHVADEVAGKGAESDGAQYAEMFAKEAHRLREKNSHDD